ncbi:hypothetical protein [Pseudomonas sp. 2822-17]|uniref:hypothetical protein n=1 Tax=Pseudomonas sp. 2822-17 TaxID=1712678 RepID=UPI00117B1044|nr:hypothetical protein [Pseudomonas sp. 2822-17]
MRRSYPTQKIGLRLFLLNSKAKAAALRPKRRSPLPGLASPIGKAIEALKSSKIKSEKIDRHTVSYPSTISGVGTVENSFALKYKNSVSVKNFQEGGVNKLSQI